MKCEGNEIICKKMQNSSARGVLRITLKIDTRLRVKLISFVILLKSARIVTESLQVNT